MGSSFEGDFMADVGSTEGSHSVASDSFSDAAPSSMNGLSKARERLKNKLA